MKPRITRTLPSIPVSSEPSLLRDLRALLPAEPVAWEHLPNLIRAQANHFRRLSSPVVTSAILRSPIIEVRPTTLPISGFAYWADDRWVVRINTSDTQGRQRFTLLHEFAHILWHGAEDVLFPGLSGTARSHAAEMAANYFAGSVLIPASLLRVAWRRTSSIEELARQFDVTPEMMQIALIQAHLIDDHLGARPFIRPPRNFRRAAAFHRRLHMRVPRPHLPPRPSRREETPRAALA